ncbi:unnamed protein product [Pedinophyceae sp. YPF-701]|nr:unnamed protein product [Pedinophyceae sp. YPF-701]
MGKDIASGAPVFAIDITEEAMPKAEAAVSSQGGSLEWGAVRNFGPNMSPPEAGMAAAANGVLHWLDVHRFCPTCGSSDLQVKRSGWMLQCGADGCRYRAFPRIDPAAIVLSVSTCGDWCLLGRKAAWAEGRYSCLAGFAEVGESIEAAAVREVEEESGIVLDLDSVWFEGTQPWPMPQSLMVGFGARVAPGRDVTKYCEESTEDRVVAGEVGLTEAERLPYLQPLPPPCKVDEDELEDARWFHRDYMEARIVHDPPTMPGPFFIPGRHSLAFELITRWLRRADRQPWAGDALRTASLGEGVQKYVLMRASEAGAGTGPDGQQRSKLIVWGHPAAAYHMNVLERCKAEARKLGLNVEPLGGGRIEHFESSGVIHVYGYSQAFGPAPHHVSAAILRRMFPFYDPDSITVSYEGY